MSLVRTRILKDFVTSKLLFTLSGGVVFLLVSIGIGLFIRAEPILESTSLAHLLTSANWKPTRGEFGFFPFIVSTLLVTGIAVVIAFPLCLLTAIYLSEYAHRKIRQILNPLIDLLAGIPSVVYGVWGVLVVVPFIQKISVHFVEFSTGYSVLSGGIVIAIMVFPLLINVLVEVFSSVPKELKEASLSVGATKWETTKHVVLRKSMPGIIAATVLAISRAFGETIAVLMVCGNTPIIPKSLFDPAYPLPALIANNYGEMLSIPLYDSALLLAALLLFVVVFLFSAVSRLILMQVEKRVT